MRQATLLLILAGWLAASSPGRAAEAQDRSGRFEPGLIVETGTRLGAADVITFTNDGQFLLAVGDDKVVRIWKVNGKLEPAATLRWSIFREMRGSIYALALSPQEGGRYVAVGGYGVRVGAGTVAVLDRKTGEVVRAVGNVPGGTSVWAVGFSPSGKRIAFGKDDGSVWVWNWEAEKGGAARRLGVHKPKDTYNFVRLTAFTSENQLISVAESGEVFRWDVTREGAAPEEPFRFDAGRLFRVAISKDRKWMAGVRPDRKNPVELWSLDGKAHRYIPLAGEEVARSVAFDDRAERLAVGFHTTPIRASFFKEIDGKVAVFDLKSSPPRRRAGPKISNIPDAVAFHPDGLRLAIAGGDDHNVTLWDLNKPTVPLSDVSGPGSCLWGVALSTDGRLLGYQPYREPDPKSVNRRGNGTWRVFDLHNSRWGSSQKFEPVLPLERTDGWSVETSLKDSAKEDHYQWWVADPAGKKHPLQFNRSVDGLPRCYTFLRGTADHPPRLVVGHAWGMSIFDLTKTGPKRTRLLTGHQGEVMAVAPSADQRTLVSTGRDQTISAWSLADWPSQAELGARFVLRRDRIFVDRVDAGSPAWEAGLLAEDEVVAFVFGVTQVYDPSGRLKSLRRPGSQSLNIDECLERLRQPVPGKEFYFVLKRQGKADPIEVLTTCRQRPLWRFFPTRTGEWVLWRWRDYYYDCSTNGDSYIGWLVSDRDVEKTPTFYRAEQFRRLFYRPDKVREMLDGSHDPARVSIPDLEPPDVQLTVQDTVVADKDVRATLTLRARGKSENQQLASVLLWLNDYRIDDPRLQALPRGRTTFDLELTIPRSKLRRGRNLLTLQGYNHAGGRGEAKSVEVVYKQPLAQPKLWGLMAAVGDYSKCQLRPGKSKLAVSDLNAHRDAEAMAQLWAGQKGKLYKEVHIKTMTNLEATPRAILDHLAWLAKQVQPDDRLVLFLGGHGTSAEELKRLIKKDGAKVVDELPPHSFAVLGPYFDHRRPNNTAVTSEDLYRAITALPCHKLILLDACHSGAVGHALVNPIRELTPDGVGPVILTACQPDQEAMEYGLLDANRAFGLFAIAVRRALEDEFDDAAGNKEKELTAARLVEYIKKKVPALVQELKNDKVPGIKPGDQQNPTWFEPALEKPLTWASR